MKFCNFGHSALSILLEVSGRGMKEIFDQIIPSTINHNITLFDRTKVSDITKNQTNNKKSLKMLYTKNEFYV